MTKLCHANMTCHYKKISKFGIILIIKNN